jgi:probable HAF family extracellular repeat protein
MTNHEQTTSTRAIAGIRQLTLSHWGRVGLILALVGTAGRMAEAQTSSCQVIDFPGGDAGSTTASGINSAGLIVGFYTTGDADESTYSGHGFSLAGTQFSTMDFPGAIFTTYNGVNSSGQIVGSYEMTFNDTSHGFLLTAGQFSTIPDPPGSVWTEALGINDAGTIVGWYEDSSGNNHGFQLSQGAFSTIDSGNSSDWSTIASGINNAGTVVGVSQGPSGDQGFKWLDGQLAALALFPGGDMTWAYSGINNTESVVGGYYIYSPFYMGAYILTSTHFRDFTCLGLTSLTAVGINDDGAIVGFGSDAAGSHGFVAPVVVFGDSDLWWFNGETPADYDETITLTSSGGSLTHWEIVAGMDKGTISASDGGQTTLTSTGTAFSGFVGDILIRATALNQTSDFTVTSHKPYSLLPVSTTYQCDNGPQGYGYLASVLYVMQDQLTNDLPRGVPVNEQFTTAFISDYHNPETNWRPGNPEGTTTNDATLSDVIGGEWPGLPAVPLATCDGNSQPVQHVGQTLQVGSETIGNGVTVQTDTIQKLVGRALHTNIVSPLP